MLDDICTLCLEVMVYIKHMQKSEVVKVNTSSIWRLIIVVMMKETLSMGILVIEFVEFLITFVKSWILEIDKSLYDHKSIS